MSITDFSVFGSWELCGFRLKAARRAAGLTQAEVAEAIGVATATYGRYETGGLCPPSDKFATIILTLHARLPEISADHILFDRPIGGTSPGEFLINGVRYRRVGGSA